MTLFRKFRRSVSNTFRELFIHHHTSLEFRAKLIAVMISANETDTEHKCEIELLKSVSQKIYGDDNDRIDTLIVTTLEYVDKVRQNNGLDIDALVLDILKDLKKVRRYYKKIDLEILEILTRCHYDTDTKDYQQSILNFFKNVKDEYIEKMEKK